MKKTTLLCALTLFTAIAASGCGSSDILSIDGDTSSMGAPENAAPTIVDGDDTITPTETGSAGEGTPATDPTDPADPADGGDQGGLPVCDATHPPPCIIVDPAPGHGHSLDDVHDHVTDLIDVEPEVGGSGVGPSGENGVGCHYQGPTGGRRMKQEVGTHTDVENILSKNDCIML